MYRTTILCLLVCFCSYTMAHTYNYAPFLDNGNAVHFGPNSGDAVAAAHTNTAAAAAIATQFTAADYEHLEKLAHEHREPFLTGPNFEYIDLVRAVLPARTQVIQTPPGFYKTQDGKVKFVSPSTLAFVAV